MKTIYTIEVLEYNKQTLDYDVIFRAPFDLIPNDIIINNVDELRNSIFLINDKIAQNATLTRFDFIKFRHPNNKLRVGKMNWKWDEEYYKNLAPNHSKGADRSDDEMFK